LGAKKWKEKQNLQDSIMGHPPLEMRQDLLRLKDWMEIQNIITLFDISI
jgi:hypothetical protein